MVRLKNAQIIFRQSKQTHRRSQAPPMFRMRRMLEVFLEMNERACRLDQAFEKIASPPSIFSQICSRTSCAS